jgi:signal transduction histidine kinase
MSFAPNNTGSIRYSHLLAFAVIAVLLGIAGYGYLLYHKQVVTDEKRQELSAIADLKAAQIVQWRTNCLTDAAAIFSNAMITHRLDEYLEGKEPEKIHREIRTWLKSLHENAEYSRTFLIKPDGKVICCVPHVPEKLSSHFLSMIEDAKEKQEVIFSDFHRDTPSGSIHLDLIIPLLTADEGRSRCIGLLALVIDPQTFLYPLLQSWPSLSKTAETILIERDGDDVLFLNDLRFRKNTALSLRHSLNRKEMPTVRAILEPDGLYTGSDYHGASVLAATRHIAGSPWVILAKIETSEIFAPIYLRAWFVALICLMTVVTAGLGIYLWWMRNQERHVRSQYESELKHNADLKQAETALQEAHREMEHRVVERTAELMETNARLRKEMAERKQLERQLLEAKKLESVGQLAGGVAHEVRNPLNAILSITEALFKEKEIEENPEYAPYIQHIRTQVRRLANLMDDLLELGKPIPASSLNPVSLHELCAETITLWQSSGDEKKQQVRLVSDPESLKPLVMADSGKLQQVVFNLIENASQHSPKGGEILVRLAVSDESVSSENMAIVRIIDSGKGIPEDKVTRIFDPFFTDRKGGTGLGLTLVRHFVENMGGDVKISNNDPPPGCMAEVRIPLAREGLE